MSAQRDLNGNKLPEYLERRDHLTLVKPANPSELSATAERSEAWCLLCARRVTVGSGEWGHAQDCQHHEQLAGEIKSEPSEKGFTVDDKQTEITGVGSSVTEAPDE